MKQSVLVLIAWLSIVAQAISATDLNQAARDACGCLKIPYQQLESVVSTINSAKKAGNIPKLQAGQNELLRVMNSSATCFETLSSKYPEIDHDDTMKQQVLKLIENQCPNPMQGNF